jgi:hypothetical protein
MSRSVGRNLLLITGAALPALLPVYLIIRYGVDTPYLDQWAPGIAGLFIKAHLGQLTLGDIVAQQNEHRIVVPRLVFLLLGWLTHWNIIVELLAVWLIVCAASVGVLWLIHRTVAAAKTSSLLFIWFICNALLFTPSAWENWLWGMGVQFVLPPALLIAALVVVDLRIPPWPKTALGMLLCTAATFSAGNGALTWVMVLLPLAWSGSWEEFKSKKWILAVWIAGFILNVGLYALHYQTLGLPPDANEPGGILDKIQYALVFLGGPLAMDENVSITGLATVLGALMFVMLLASFGYFLWLWLRRREFELCRRMLIWLALGGFAVMSGAMVGAFRTHLPALLAMASRYCPYETCLPIALVNLVAIIWDDLRIPQKRQNPASSFILQPSSFLFHLPAFLSAALLMFQLKSFVPGLRNAREESMLQIHWKAAVLLAKVLPDNAILRYAAGPRDHARLVQAINQLNDMHYLRPPLIETKNAAEIPSAPTGSAEGALEAMHQEETGALLATGWATCPQRSWPANSVFIAYDNENHEPIILTLADRAQDRPEIAQRMGDPSLSPSGWSATLPIDRLPPELKLIKLSAWVLDGETGRVTRLQGELTLDRR